MKFGKMFVDDATYGFQTSTILLSLVALCLCGPPAMLEGPLSFHL